MAITDDERAALIEYIQQRKCDEARRGEDCVERSEHSTVVGNRHPACRRAEEMEVIAKRA